TAVAAAARSGGVGSAGGCARVRSASAVLLGSAHPMLSPRPAGGPPGPRPGEGAPGNTGCAAAGGGGARPAVTGAVCAGGPGGAGWWLLGGPCGGWGRPG